MLAPADQPPEPAGDLDALITSVGADRGGVFTVELTTGQLQTFLDTIWRMYLPAYDDVEGRLVLGVACETREAAVRHLTAALQLPYAAAAGWEEFHLAVTDRPAARRECVVVADADRLLPHDPAGRREVIQVLHRPFTCLGGGFSTLVLVTVVP